MGRARVHVSKSRTISRSKIKVRRNSVRGNPNKCPICGKFTTKG